MPSTGDEAHLDKPILHYAPQAMPARRDLATVSCIGLGMLITFLVFLMSLEDVFRKGGIDQGVQGFIAGSSLILLIADTISIWRRSLLATRIAMVFWNVLFICIVVRMLLAKGPDAQVAQLLFPIGLVVIVLLGHSHWKMLIMKSRAQHFIEESPRRDEQGIRS